MKKRILAVEDDSIILQFIKSSLSEAGFEVISYTNGKEALEYFLESPTQVLISDLSMPEMSGNELIGKIFQNGHYPVIIVLSGKTDVNVAVSLLKQGVYDYMMKPFTSMEIKNRVSKAFEFAELKSINETIIKEKEARIENQLNWNLYRESIIKRDSSKVDSKLMSNINTHLVQGSGIGALTGIAEMIKFDYKLDNDRYSISKELVEMLFANIEISGRLISSIADIDNVINQNLPKQKLSLNEISGLIQSVISENEFYQKINKNEIKLSEKKFKELDGSVEINAEYFRKAIKELLINAYKFSDSNSKIYILFEIGKDNFQIQILNPPQKEKKHSEGILPEYQNIIFEPFFRLSKFVFESYNTLDYGLGLCYVEKIIQNHYGKISISNLKNFLDESQPLLINVMIELPLVK